MAQKKTIDERLAQKDEGIARAEQAVEQARQRLARLRQERSVLQQQQIQATLVEYAIAPNQLRAILSQCGIQKGGGRNVSETQEENRLSDPQ